MFGLRIYVKTKYAKEHHVSLVDVVFFVWSLFERTLKEHKGSLKVSN